MCHFKGGGGCHFTTSRAMVPAIMPVSNAEIFVLLNIKTVFIDKYDGSHTTNLRAANITFLSLFGGPQPASIASPRRLHYRHLWRLYNTTTPTFGINSGEASKVPRVRVLVPCLIVLVYSTSIIIKNGARYNAFKYFVRMSMEIMQDQTDEIFAT